MADAAHVLHIEGDCVHVPASAFGHGGFRDWVTSEDFPERVRATFIAGEVLLTMSPESIESHNKVKTAITIALGSIVSAEDLGEAWSDGVLLTHEATSLSTEPDFMFAAWRTLEAGGVRFVPKARRPNDFIELTGAPDLVVEIVSDSSHKKDLTLLRAAYAQAGIPEYWIVDARREDLRFEILELLGDVYRATAPSDQPQLSRALGRSFALARSRNRAGRWSYSLSAAG